MKTGDFVKLNYTGKLEDGTVFDTTLPDVAKEAGMDTNIQPVTICIGEKMLIPGLDKALLKKKGAFSTTIPSDEAFGKKDPKLLRIVPTQQLNKQNITPHVGMQLNIDNHFGVVRKTGGGRTVVDFNHPLAGKDVTYDVEVLEEVQSTNAKIAALLKSSGLSYKTITVHEKKATIEFEEMLPQQLLDVIQATITRLTPVTVVTFEKK